jgi:hypothetical protein
MISSASFPVAPFAFGLILPRERFDRNDKMLYNYLIYKDNQSHAAI